MLPADLDSYKKTLAHEALIISRYDESLQGLAELQHNRAKAIQSHSQKSLRWLKKSLNSYNKIHKKTDAIWLAIANLQFDIALQKEQQDPEKNVLAQAVIDSLKNIKNDDQLQVLILRAQSFNLLGTFKQAIERSRYYFLQSMDAFEAIQSIENIQLSNDYWSEFAITQINLATTYDKDHWETAQRYYMAALDSLNVEVKNAGFFAHIQNVYKKLSQCYKNNEAKMQNEVAICSLGAQLFSDNEVDPIHIKSQFYDFYKFVLQASISELDFFLPLLAQLTQLVELSVDMPDYPNKKVKVWLQLEDEQKDFQKLLTNVQKLYLQLSQEQEINTQHEAILVRDEKEEFKPLTDDSVKIKKRLRDDGEFPATKVSQSKSSLFQPKTNPVSQNKYQRVAKRIEEEAKTTCTIL